MNIKVIRLIISIIISIVIFLFILFAVLQNKNLGRIYDIIFSKSTPKVVYKAEETIKVLEGWTDYDIANYFAEQGKWSSGDILDVTESASSTKYFTRKYNFFDGIEKPKSLEGYLFPDTYRIFASSTVSDILVKMLDNFDHKLTPQMRADIKSQNKSISEIVIMASIIEKEAPFHGQDNGDAKIVSGIFWNRIRNNQALQSDATLSFILRDNKPAHSGNELNNTSLYNTYKYRGLTPGPICNPGLLAIEAAIYPTKTSYNYFLTAPDGNIYYAKTYDDHLQNKYKYLK